MLRPLQVLTPIGTMLLDCSTLLKTVSVVVTVVPVSDHFLSKPIAHREIFRSA